jgi:superfamily II DNA or RNA helicase
MVGSITLYPHQRSAIERLQIALDHFNGALLCDDVGMGKTYVAIGVAKGFRRPLVVAPAALIPMWRAALAATCSEAELVTFEALSRADSDTNRGVATPSRAYDLVVIDEAHHVRNPRTNRYFALESLVRGAKVLLLSATPIHNRRDDLIALLSLFLGSRARAMTSAELALCVVRREHKQLERSVHIPAVAASINHPVPDDRALVERLMDLPPPVPLRDGGLGGALIGRGLVHQWASSEAALHEAVRRRIARATALCASLEAGTYPTAAELETWVYGEGALQLGFAELLSSPVIGHNELLSCVRAHLAGLEVVRARFASDARIDFERARIVAGIRADHPRSKIVAFAQYAGSVSMLFRRLSRGGRLAMLTSHGARVAGGSLTRIEAINRFAPVATASCKPAVAEEIDLLLTTDLLSEGVNLQDADVVVHVDIPWTVARLEQRVGRVARLGSPHPAVTVHAIRPPASAVKVLRSESIVQRKWRVTKSVVGTTAPNPWLESDASVSLDDSPLESTPAKTEQLRTLLESWMTGDATSVLQASVREQTIAATVETAAKTGFAAAVSTPGRAELIVAVDDRVSTDLSDQIRACAAASATEAPTSTEAAECAVRMIQDWFTRSTASAAAGLGASSALRRREITSRIDAAIEGAPPHLRTSRLIAAARARKVATTPQCAAVERELDALSKSELLPDEWLAAVGDLDVQQATQNVTTGEEPLKIHAILLLRARS